MHEYPVTRRILEVALKTAREKKAYKVNRVNLVIGELSGFIGESIQMYFDILSKGSPAEGAKITVKSIKPKLKCTSCGTHFEREGYSFTCPVCGKEGVLSETGREFYIESIDIETEG